MKDIILHCFDYYSGNEMVLCRWMKTNEFKFGGFSIIMIIAHVNGIKALSNFNHSMNKHPFLSRIIV